jgi:hypothetical protein
MNCGCSLCHQDDMSKLIAELHEVELAHGKTAIQFQELKKENEKLKQELAQWKELHAKHTSMVIPGETDSADAYRIMHFQLKNALKEILENHFYGDQSEPYRELIGLGGKD